MSKSLPLTYTTRGGEVVVIPAPPERGKHYVMPNGYAAKPGTGPKGETCGSCKHKTYVQHARRYLKCELAVGKWTGGRGSDILARAAACQLWEARDVREDSKPEGNNG